MSSMLFILMVFINFFGIVKLLYLGKVFGIGQELDSYFFSYVCIDLFYTLGAVEGPFYVAFLYLANYFDSNKGRFQDSISFMFLILFSIFSFIGLISFFAPNIVASALIPLVKHSNYDSAALMKMVSTHVQYLAPAFIFRGVSSFLIIVFNYKKLFHLNFIRQIFIMLVEIAFIYLFSSKIGIYSVTLGFSVGEAVSTIILLIYLFAYTNIRFSIPSKFSESVPDLKKIFSVINPNLVNHLLTRTFSYITSAFCSMFSAGSRSSFEYANKIYNLPIRVATNCIVSPFYQGILEENKKNVNVDEKVKNAIVVLNVFYIPLFVFIAFFSKDIVRLMLDLMSGESAFLDLISGLLLILSVVYVFESFEIILIRLMYSIEEFKKIAFFNFISFVISTIAIILFIGELKIYSIALGMLINKLVFSIIIFSYLIKLKVINARQVFNKNNLAVYVLSPVIVFAIKMLAFLLSLNFVFVMITFLGAYLFFNGVILCRSKLFTTSSN